MLLEAEHRKKVSIMSHFTVLVIGENPEEQLAPFDESIEVDEYVDNTISEEDKESFRQYYIRNKKSPADMSFEDMYEIHGESWNGNRWKKDTDGVWKNFSTYNPLSKWDWYSLGGRWTGFFKLKKKILLEAGQTFFNELGFSQGEVENLIRMYQNNRPVFDQMRKKYNGKSEAILEMVEKELAEREKQQWPEHVIGEPGIMTEEAKEGYADQVLKKHIDFAGMRWEAEEKAAKEYDYAMSILGMLPPNETWEQVRKRVAGNNTDLMDKAREEYWAQPRCVAWQTAGKGGRPFGPNPDDYLISREQFIRKARNSEISTYAVLKNGQWLEKGEMGWFGMSNDKYTQEEWDEKFNQMIDELPDDTLMSLYDCHI